MEEKAGRCGLSESRARSRWHRTQEKPFDRSSSESEELDQSCCGRRRWSRREHFAFVVGLALANRDDFALLWFVFSRVRDDDSTPSCADFFYSPHQNAVVQWGKLCGHCQVSQSACDPEIEVSSLDQLFLSMWAIMMLETSTSSLLLLVYSTSGGDDMRSFWEQTGILGPIYHSLGEGLDDRDIAKKLGLTEVNVQNCIAWVLHLLKLKDRQELVLNTSAGA